MTTLKSVPDGEIAKFVVAKLLKIDTLLLAIGQAEDGMRMLTEQLLDEQNQLKNALRDGIFQRHLNL